MSSRRCAPRRGETAPATQGEPRRQRSFDVIRSRTWTERGDSGTQAHTCRHTHTHSLRERERERERERGRERERERERETHTHTRARACAETKMHTHAHTHTQRHKHTDAGFGSNGENLVRSHVRSNESTGSETARCRTIRFALTPRCDKVRRREHKDLGDSERHPWEHEAEGGSAAPARDMRLGSESSHPGVQERA